MSRGLALVLIFAADWDLLARGVASELKRRGSEYAVLGADWWSQSTLAWIPQPFAGHVELGGERLELVDVAGVLARNLHAVPNALETPAGDAFYLQAESTAALLALLDAIPCPVINPPRPIPYSRPLLIGAATTRRAGLRPAPFVLTSERAVTLAACARAAPNGAVVGRPSGAWADRLVVDEVAAREAVDSLLPGGAVFVQPVVAPEPLVVFVAGEHVIGCRPSSWPARVTAFEPHAISDGLRASARALADELGVSLLRLTAAERDGEWWSIDVDTTPLLGDVTSEVAGEVICGVVDLLVGSAST